MVTYRINCFINKDSKCKASALAGMGILFPSNCFHTGNVGRNYSTDCAHNNT